LKIVTLYRSYDHDRVMPCGKQTHRFWTLKHSKANPLTVVLAENKVIRGAASVDLKFTTWIEPIPKDAVTARGYTPQLHGQQPPPDTLAALHRVLSADALSVMAAEDKQLLWEYRHWARGHPHALCKVLLCVDWTSRDQELEMLSIMQEWEPLSHQDALGLLDACYAHADVRSHAVAALASIDDDYLLGTMLQLTQALKYEPYHMSSLAMFLLQRALQNRLIGHRFFWYLKAEIHQIEIRERCTPPPLTLQPLFRLTLTPSPDTACWWKRTCTRAGTSGATSSGRTWC